MSTRQILGNAISFTFLAGSISNSRSRRALLINEPFAVSLNAACTGRLNQGTVTGVRVPARAAWVPGHQFWALSRHIQRCAGRLRLDPHQMCAATGRRAGRQNVCACLACALSATELTAVFQEACCAPQRNPPAGKGRGVAVRANQFAGRRTAWSNFCRHAIPCLLRRRNHP